MRLLIVGCEYSGTTALTNAICRWGESVFGGRVGLHDHFKIPHISHPPGLTDEEQAQFLALSPNMQEMFQRYHMEYHVGPPFYQDLDHILVGMQCDEAVYAPLYYGYGGKGEYGDRRRLARQIDRHIMEVAPDTVLVLVSASSEVIAKRMKEDPHQNAVLQEKDIELVLQRFEEEYWDSLIRRRFSIDTSTATVEESLNEFVSQITPLLTEADRVRMLAYRVVQTGA